MSRNLQLRLLTAIVGLPLLFAVTWIGNGAFAFAAAAIALLAAAEFVHGWLFPSMPITAVFPQVVMFCSSAFMVAGVDVEPGFVWIGVGFGVLFAAIGYTPTNAFGPRKPWRVQSWCIAYVGLLMCTVVLLRDANGGRGWLFLGLLSTFAVDTGAYATGKLLGRHKLAPKISPGKTWEGAIGGYVAGAAAVFVLNSAFGTGVSAATIAPFALVMPVVAIAGDLFESWMKRRMGVKDTSGLLPGHGGFLDRLDSILFVVPVLYLFLRVRVL